MEVITVIINIIQNLLDFSNSKYLMIIILLIIILYHTFFHFLRDRKYLKILKKFHEPEQISIDDFKSLPLVNIIIPAWNEGIVFKDCLISIANLKYPDIKVIISAGGSEETVEIANSFKEKYDNFIFLRQEKGQYKIQGKNKIRAINQCLAYVSEGIVYLIDADCYLTDEILLRMLYPIINENESVVCGENRPLKSIEDKDLVKYLLINSIGYFNGKFTRYYEVQVSGPNTCLTYKVIKKIGTFREKQGEVIEEITRAKDIISNGFRIYRLKDFRSAIYTEYPTNYKELYNRRRRYIGYRLNYYFQTKSIKSILKVYLLFLISIFLFLLPIILFFHLGLFFIGVFIFFSIYLKRVRKYIFFRMFINKKDFGRFGLTFPIKMIFYTVIEILLNVLMFIALFFKKKL